MVFIISPLVLTWLSVLAWRKLKQTEYIKNIEWVLLEIKLPRELLKSPQAMEIVLAAFHQTNEGQWFSRLTEGVIRPWFSLEIASFGGEVHFYVRTDIKFKNLIEAQIYSQYPEVEIVEAEDYTLTVPYGLPDSDWDLAGFEFVLSKEDAYPIKTYVDYGLDKDPKEELKVDPLTPVLELLGSLKPGEQMWFQILVMATKERFAKKGSWFKKVDWTKKAEELIQEKNESTLIKDGGKVVSARFLTPGETDVLKAISRSIGKLGFDCGFRTMYLAKQDIFDKVNFGAMASIIKQFSSADLNGFKPGHSTSIKYPWQDITGRKALRFKAGMFDNYRRRAYFYQPLFDRKKVFVLNTEELATIYHFPGQVAETPTLGRIESRRGEPPANLPT